MATLTSHVTTHDSDEEMLDAWLRKDQFWGKNVSNMESVVDVDILPSHFRGTSTPIIHE